LRKYHKYCGFFFFWVLNVLATNRILSPNRVFTVVGNNVNTFVAFLVGNLKENNVMLYYSYWWSNDRQNKLL